MAGERNRRGEAVLAFVVAAVMLIGLIGIERAEAKPGKPAAPDKLTLSFKMEPMPPMAEPIPGAITEGRAYYGKLTLGAAGLPARPSCLRAVRVSG